jgi:RNA polymerase sigma-70 factor (ECF subfamily)
MARPDVDDGSVRDISEPSKDSYHDFVSKIEREQVQTAIQALSVNCREIILLREFEALSYEEIAGLLDCPVGTVMSRLARARSNLRAFLTSTKHLAIQSGGVPPRC